jgi:hypothetical protein
MTVGIIELSNYICLSLRTMIKPVTKLPSCFFILISIAVVSSRCSKKSNPALQEIVTVSNFAGNGIPGFANGVGAAASFAYPMGITSDANGNVYVADQGNLLIRKITPDGTVTTYAGNGDRGTSVGSALSSPLELPTTIVSDSNGNIFVTVQAGLVIEKISANGIVSIFAGSGFIGSIDDVGAAASFAGIGGMAIDANGNMFVTDINAVRKITPQGAVSTIVKGGLTNTSIINSLSGITVDMNGNLYVVNSGHHNILKINQQYAISVYAGSVSGFNGDSNGIGTAATFNNPVGVAIDSKSNLYVTDGGNHLIRMISPTAIVSTLAGGGVGVDVNGNGNIASFEVTYGITVDPFGNIYVTDQGTSLIRKIVVTQ